MNKNMWCLENCEVIERLNNTIDTLSKELETYKKAFELACEEIERRAPYPKAATIIAEDWERFYIKKARKENEKVSM